MNNPQIVFVKNLLTSRIFLTQFVALVALVATMAGVHSQWASEAAQAEIVAALDAVFTTVFRLWGPNGPVSLSAPLTAPAMQELPPGTHTVTVTPPPPPSVPAVSVVAAPPA